MKSLSSFAFHYCTSLSTIEEYILFFFPLTALPGSGGKRRHRSHDSDEVEDVSSAKKHLSNRPLGLPSANIKIENRSNGDSSSIVVSIEINGATYQGVLFAEPGKHRTPTS